MNWDSFQDIVVPKFENGEELFVQMTKNCARTGTIGKIVEIDTYVGFWGKKQYCGSFTLKIDEKHILENRHCSDFY